MKRRRRRRGRGSRMGGVGRVGSGGGCSSGGSSSSRVHSSGRLPTPVGVHRPTSPPVISTLVLIRHWVQLQGYVGRTRQAAMPPFSWRT